jgi:hypothetical protein
MLFEALSRSPPPGPRRSITWRKPRQTAGGDDHPPGAPDQLVWVGDGVDDPILLVARMALKRTSRQC